MLHEYEVLVDSRMTFIIGKLSARTMVEAGAVTRRNKQSSAHTGVNGADTTHAPLEHAVAILDLHAHYCVTCATHDMPLSQPRLSSGMPFG